MTDPDDPETVTVMADLTACPHCSRSLIGDPIPANRRAAHGGHTHYSRLVAIYDPDLDRTVRYQCPDCRERIRS